jgi:hypothetical protein
MRFVSNAALASSNQLSKSFFEVRRVIDGSFTFTCCGSLVVCVAIFGRDRSIDAFLTCRSDSSVSLTRLLCLFGDIDVVVHQYRDCFPGLPSTWSFAVVHVDRMRQQQRVR